MTIDPIVPLLMLALLPAPSAAQEPLSLSQALERAQAQNPEIRALRERSTGALARVEASRRQNLPRVGVEMNAQRTNNAASVFAARLNASEFGAQDFEIARLNSPSALSHLGTSLFVEMPLDLAGRNHLASDALAASSRAFAENIREAEATLHLQVTEAYFGVVLAGRAEDATEKALAAARSREEITNERFVEGVALQADLLRVRARRRAREADLSAKRSELAIGEAMLRRLMGAPPDAEFSLVDAASPSATPPESLDAWMSRAAFARPSLRALGEQQAAASFATRLQKRTSWPELAAQARLMDDRTSFSGGGQSWAVGAVLRFHVFDATREKRLAGAVSEEQATIEDGRATRDRVRFEVESAYRLLTAAKERLAAAAGGAEEGREALRVIQERRAQGLATLTDELETEAAAFAAELEEIAAARAAVLAEAALRRAAGDTLGSTIQ